ncbi:hypothetical protein F2P79_002543 [Pimephales promelas]|nr:hypothetical protein F2P79_002543 [Pimephales promelas]
MRLKDHFTLTFMSSASSLRLCIPRLIPILIRCADLWTGDQIPVHPAERVTTPDQCCQGSLISTTSTGVCPFSIRRRHERVYW